MKIEFSKREKGITLIALIITIIILLILAGVTIGTLSRTGIFNKAKQTASTYDEKRAEEDVSLLLKEWMMDNAGNGIALGDFLDTKVQAQLIEIDDSVNEEDNSKIGIIKDKYVVTVDKNGNIIETQKVGPKPTVDASSIAITLEDGTEVTDGSQELGTRLKISFNTSMESGNITKVEVTSVSPTVQATLTTTGGVTTASYVTNGTDMQVKFKIYGKVGEEEFTKTKTISVKSKYEIVREAVSLLKAIGDNTFENDSYSKVQVQGTNGTEVYSLHVYNFNGNQTWSENKTFGTENDVSTTVNGTRQYAKNMVVVKVNGDLTINSNVTVAPYYNSSTGYGGPKGFMLYVTGTLTNNGTIDNSYGAYAEGQDVYLWKNANGSFEYVPAVGANGGETSTGKGNSGYSGTTVNNRATAGGGSGGSLYGASAAKGGCGTSYSGGTGGGGAYKVASSQGDEKGGAGGAAGPTTGYRGGGGAGNPGGTGWGSGGTGGSGTGGLIVIYSNEYINNGTISAKGKNGGTGTDGHANGGSSGGGSINIFTNQAITRRGTMNVSGGISVFENGSDVSKSTAGGAGGTGTISAGSISTGTYVEYTE